ncbi:MAG: S1C family serine protease [Syntrophobacteraceae bacterium]|nr:S1C family serine protease [Syntrophobacteraceae bacterium]
MKKIILIHVALAACAIVFLLHDSGMSAGWTAQTVRRVQRATVTVYVFDVTGKPVGQGSGFFFREYGHLITNYHVLGRASAARVKTFDGSVFNVKSIIARDKRDDVLEALVDMPYGSAPYLVPSGPSPRPGDPLLVTGSPLGVARVVSTGRVIEIAPIPELGKCIVHDARAARGSSGGPVVNQAGEVIGMETAGLVGRPNIDFAIPVERFSGFTSCYRELQTIEATAYPKGSP